MLGYRNIYERAGGRSGRICNGLDAGRIGFPRRHRLPEERLRLASPSSKAMISKDSTVMREAGNKIRYTPVVSLRDKAMRNRWSDAVIAALKEQRPEMLA